MKVVKVKLSDSLYAGLVEMSRKDGNDISTDHGVATAVRKCIKRHLCRLGMSASNLERTDEQFATSEDMILW